MTYLFVDTTNHLTFGLLDEGFKWLDFVELQDKKSSGKIHSLIYEVLEKNGLKAKELKAMFHISGPGSYTGMRVSEGLAQILKWQNIPTYSFYHFEIPSILNIESGAWISNAFKGELFLYTWDEDGSNKELLLSSNLKESLISLKLKYKNLFTHFSTEFEMELNYSSELVRSHSENLFNVVMSNKMNQKPFYYRSLDQEFKISKK